MKTKKFRTYTFKQAIKSKTTDKFIGFISSDEIKILCSYYKDNEWISIKNDNNNSASYKIKAMNSLENNIKNYCKKNKDAQPYGKPFYILGGDMYR